MIEQFPLTILSHVIQYVPVHVMTSSGVTEGKYDTPLLTVTVSYFEELFDISLIH